MSVLNTLEKFESPFKWHCSSQECEKVVGPFLPEEGTTEFTGIIALNFGYHAAMSLQEASLSLVTKQRDELVEAVKLAKYEFECLQANLICDDPKDGIGWAVKRAKDSVGYMDTALALIEQRKGKS